jgi:hypothetical protein
MTPVESFRSPEWAKDFHARPRIKWVTESPTDTYLKEIGFSWDDKVPVTFKYKCPANAKS